VKANSTVMPRALAHGLDRLAAAWRFDRGVIAQPAQPSKRRHLLALFRERGHDTLVETGTYLGETVHFFVPHARRIVSIEIDPSLHERAARRFAGNENVEILLGDALDLAPRLISELDTPCLLWLDGHFSGGGTGRGELDEPVVEILKRIRELPSPPGMTVVIDDLRRFGRERDVPSLESVIEAARETFPGAQITAELDSLVIRAA
jgi:hypothetical protein